MQTSSFQLPDRGALSKAPFYPLYSLLLIARPLSYFSPFICLVTFPTLPLRLVLNYRSQIPATSQTTPLTNRPPHPVATSIAKEFPVLGLPTNRWIGLVFNSSRFPSPSKWTLVHHPAVPSYPPPHLKGCRFLPLCLREKLEFSFRSLSFLFLCNFVFLAPAPSPFGCGVAYRSPSPSLFSE